MLDNLIGKAKSQMSGIEEFFAGLPGIKGYKDKEQRREADKTVRTLLARQLDDQKKRLNGLQAELIEAGQLDMVDDIERSAMKLQTLSDRIRTASYGYAPLFDDVRVTEAELDALAKFDEAMVEKVKEIATAIDGMSELVSTPDADWKTSLRALNNLISQLNTEFGHRSEAILQSAPEE
ncbi:MAG: hypothetical protein WAZ19_04880 [Anaerolineae bacterium]